MHQRKSELLIEQESPPVSGDVRNVTVLDYGSPIWTLLSKFQNKIRE